VIVMMHSLLERKKKRGTRGKKNIRSRRATSSKIWASTKKKARREGGEKSKQQ